MTRSRRPANRGAARRRAGVIRAGPASPRRRRSASICNPKTAIVVLGAPNDAAGRLSAMVVARCRQALCEFARHPDACILPTGGWGAHFNTTDKPHGYYTRRFLQQQGHSAGPFPGCAESSNTIQDAELSRADYRPPRHNRYHRRHFRFPPRARNLVSTRFSGMELAFSAARTDLPAAELARLQAHETRALRS